jgi:hypothetical protein
MLGVAVAVAVAGVVWGLPLADQWRRTRMAEQLARHAESLAGGAARLGVRRLGEWELDALDSLARLAGSANADAADAARVRIENQLVAWETAQRTTHNGPEFAQRLAALAAALAKHVAAYDDVARRWSDPLGLRIARACDGLAPNDAMGVLAACDRVLSAPAPAPAATIRRAEVDAAAAPTASAASSPAGNGTWRRDGHAAPRAEATRPGALPLAAATTKEGSTGAGAATEPTPAAPDGGNLRVVDAPADPPNRAPIIRDAAVMPLPFRTPDSGDVASSLPSSPAFSRPRPLPAPEDDPSLVDLPNPQQQRVLLRKFRLMSDRELAARLATASGFEADVLQQALRERERRPTARGPSSRAALSQAAPRPFDVERELVERVSELPPERARVLLRALASDDSEEPDTRLQALTLLATSDDPQLAEIARQRALKDPDPRVAELATRILREERAK